MQALSHAILAPNPHNRQPWLVGLDSPGQVEIWRDKEKNLPETDPFDRQLTIGMGCFLEQLAIAASASGHAVDFDLFPDGEDGPVLADIYTDTTTVERLQQLTFDAWLMDAPQFSNHGGRAGLASSIAGASGVQ